MMLRCDATPMPVDDDARRGSSNNSDGAACSAMGCSYPHKPMVRCKATAWADETEEGGRLKVPVTRSDPVAGTAVVVTEEQAIPRARLTGTGAERRSMARKRCERLWQAMQHVQMRENRLTVRAVGRARLYHELAKVVQTRISFTADIS
jgi:hypothetical protein